MYSIRAGAALSAVLVGAGTLHGGLPRAEPIDRFAWVAGCWTSDRGAAMIEEHWMAARGGSMLGMSRTIKDGRLVEYELVIVRTDGARLAYEAHPSGQSVATFLETPAPDAKQVVFENPGHDFPQRIGYRSVQPDSAVAWIEGTLNGKTKRIDFPYYRVSCPSP